MASPCVVTVVVPASGDAMWIRLIGDVELGAESALDAAVGRVRAASPAAVVVDLAGTTYAGALLAYFLARIHIVVPHASIAVRHTSPTIRLVLAATGIDDLLT